MAFTLPNLLCAGSLAINDKAIEKESTLDFQMCFNICKIYCLDFHFPSFTLGSHIFVT